jgi:hypothetical protein
MVYSMLYSSFIGEVFPLELHSVSNSQMLVYEQYKPFDIYLYCHGNKILYWMCNIYFWWGTKDVFVIYLLVYL